MSGNRIEVVSAGMTRREGKGGSSALAQAAADESGGAATAGLDPTCRARE